MDEMNPMLDNLELPQVQEIATYNRRMLAEHKPPGMDGSLLQNLGRRPMRLSLWGIAAGDEALQFIEALDAKFRANQPVPFVADITADAEIDQMIIDEFKAQELAGKPHRYSYTLELREYIEPVEPVDLQAVDTSVLDEAGNLMDDLVDGLDISMDFASGLERFASSMSDLLARLAAFNRTIGNE
jgi:hypothetical protein